jgi:hypothetical protein
MVTIITPDIIAVDQQKEFVNESKYHLNYDKTYDNNSEIITRINGYAKLKWINIKFGFSNLKYGEAEIMRGIYDGVNLFGIKKINGGRKIFFERDIEYIHTSKLLGYDAISMIPGHECQAFTFGYAFGNIDCY